MIGVAAPLTGCWLLASQSVNGGENGSYSKQLVRKEGVCSH